MVFEKISAPSLRETFIQEIEGKILSGELKIGDKLPPARELCTLMGVSLSTVSTGIAELTNKGFIEVKPRHGAYVADYIHHGTLETFLALLHYDGGNLRKNEIRSFTESRMAMDPFVAELVAERADDETLQRLRPIQEAFCASERIEAACVHMTDFFKELYAMSGNSFFTLLYSASVEVQRGMYAMYFEKNGLENTKTLMVALCDALCARETERAKALMLQSLRTATEGDTAIIS